MCWNTEGWRKPSGPVGKSRSKETYERRAGYGHEEWLLDTTRVIDGWLYGCLQPIGIHRSKYVGKTFNISLYSIDQDTRRRWWIGRIRDVEVISPEDSTGAYTVYKTRGWLAEMEQQLRDVIASVNEFRKSKPETFFVLRYRPQSLDLLESPVEFPKRDPAVRVTYYVLLDQKEVPHLHRRNGGFAFVPGHKAEKHTAVAAYEQQSQNIDLVQNRMQTAIYHQLAAKFGEANVGTEIPTGQGSEIDLVVKQADGEFDFYEIKTSYSIRLNIRQALGQLLEYAYYPQPKTVKKLIIVSDQALTPESKDYLDSLRQRFRLPVYYQRYDPAKQLLDDALY